MSSDIKNNFISLFYNYHEFVCGTVESVKRSVSRGEEIEGVAKKCIGVSLAPIVYAVLSMGALVEQMFVTIDMLKTLSSGMTLKLEIEKLKNSGAPSWREDAVALVRKARLDDTEKELRRLRGSEVLSQEVMGKLRPAYQHWLSQLGVVPAFWRSEARKLAIYRMYGEAFELKRIYEDQYDVVLHAQEFSWLAMTYLVKALEQADPSAAPLRHFKPLRASCETASATGVEAVYRFVNRFNPWGLEGIEYYTERSVLTTWDEDPKVKEELLSVDAYWFNSFRWESSLWFLAVNQNITGASKVFASVAQKTMEHYLKVVFKKEVPRARITHLVEKIQRIIDAHRSTVMVGGLFVICIRKERSSKTIYRAHPFGVPCSCHPSAKAREILDKLQKGILDSTTQCTSPPTPQYRVYLPELTPEKGNKVFLINPLPKAEKQKMKTAIQAVVQELVG